MDTFWIIWAVMFGIFSTNCSDDWSQKVARSSAFKLLGFCFLGIGIPIIWAPTLDEKYWPPLIVGSAVSAIAFGFGFLFTLGVRFMSWKADHPKG